jgi:hypothetical protein
MAGNPDNAPINISLMQPRFFGPGVYTSAPLYIWNTLTNEIKGYQSAADVLMGQPFFDFTGWPPSIYQINNASTAVLPVVLFEQTYLVEPGQLWVFIAHDEIGSHIAWLEAGNVSRTIESYWDVSLGGSIWDAGDSLWDVYTP